MTALQELPVGTVSIVVIFLRLAKEILFHHFRLQVCTGKHGVTHLDDCRGFNLVLCKT